MKNRTPSISFGIIVLNGEPFTRYCIRQLYPFAHQIIVVEGASPAAAAIATHGGHSSDGTLDVLHDLKRNEDPDNKLTIVTAEDEGHPDGFWPGEKHEQSSAYASHATGDYLWQVDIDEFYQPEDMKALLDLLSLKPAVSAASFKTLTFWGGLSWMVDGYYLRRGGNIFHRIFQWGPGYRYVTHRPPTVQTASGADVRTMNAMSGEYMESLGIYLYHYALLFPKQVREKCTYYDHATWIRKQGYRQWAQDNYFHLKNPFRVHNVYDEPSWLEPFPGVHPPQIRSMMSDIRDGTISVEERKTDDIELILNSTQYRVWRQYLRSRYFLSTALTRAMASGRRGIRSLRKGFMRRG